VNREKHGGVGVQGEAATTTVVESKSKSATNDLRNSTISYNNNDNDEASLSDTNYDLESTTTSTPRTVGILIIGDEILKGLTPDTNTHAAATALHANGVPLSRVVVVSDDQNEIVRELGKLNEMVDVIITSGGVGPTHDDVTIKSVADALGSEMVLNQDMADLLIRKMNDHSSGDVDADCDETDSTTQLTEAQTKMATLPGCSKLKDLSGIEGDWPVLQCANIFILPGVPQFFEKKVQHVASYLSTELERSVAFKVVLSIDENSIVPILNHVVENHPNVSFGSYPFVNHPEYKTVVTLEGRRKEVSSGTGSGSDSSSSSLMFEQDEIDVHVKVALSDLVNGLPEGSVLRVDNNNDLTFI